MTWLQHVEGWKDCQRCPLGGQRGRICLARACKAGDPPGAYGRSVRCDVLFIGEAPGQSEDAVGLPFVGPAGDLLDQIRMKSLPEGVRCTFTNLVACFPREAKATGNHQPERGEVLSCRPRLVDLVNLAQPRLIVRVGELVQRYVAFQSTTPFVDIVHPAYILARLPLAQKRFAVDRCVVQIRNAYEDIAPIDPSKPFTPWETEDAEGQPKTRRQEIQTTYEGAYDWEQWKPRDHPEPGDDNGIPF